MERKTSQIDFWYAVNNTRVLVPPKKTLETFGNTILNYHLVSELMDVAGKVRIREGRLVAMKPLILVPDAGSLEMEGFGAQAKEYMDWLKENEDQIRILRYGYSLKQESFSEQVVSDSVENVVERVKADVERSDHPFDAVVLGVDDPWDVCLVRLFWVVMTKSAPENIREFELGRRQEREDGISAETRMQVERAFHAAERDSSLTGELGKLLQKLGLFEHYQDRFFQLVRR
ncbi:MAG: hypothetical protein J5985_05395 [Kiritimatiellae bacterium]|nr:hypothetical protein [Kiritimatiellia bacterium]